MLSNHWAGDPEAPPVPGEEPVPPEIAARVESHPS